MKSMNLPSLRNLTLFAAIVVVVLLLPNLAHAAGAGGIMPWDTNLQRVSQSFTGPFAYAITILGLVSACAILMFAQEIPYFVKAVVFVVLIGSLLMGANAFAATMGWTGAVI